MQRLRTVLMTALLAVLGLLTVAMSREIGSGTQRPLAIVIIDGLITATLLTLVVLSALYVRGLGRHQSPPQSRMQSLKRLRGFEANAHSRSKCMAGNSRAWLSKTAMLRAWLA